jgi:replicative DNA helicase
MNTPDRLPPFDMEAERGALGCCLLDPCLIAEVRREWFYDLRHQKLFDALTDLSASGKPVDVSTFCHHLSDRGLIEAVGGLQYVSVLPDVAPSAHNLPYWKKPLGDKLLMRRILTAAIEAAGLVYDPTASAEEILDTFERNALAIRQNDGPEQRDIKTLVQEAIDEFQECFEHKGKIRGVATGFLDLDCKTHGLRPGQLMVIAARPSVGKTSLAMNIGERVAIDEKVPVGIFSLEMTGRELVFRLQCCRARVNLSDALSGELSERDFQGLTVASGEIAKAPLFIDDTPGLSIGQLRARARRMKQNHGIELLIVDYLGLLRAGEKRPNRYEETTIISAGLKGIAKELHLPLIALCQLNRDSERDKRKPFLSDLRDSGSIEQDADLVALLHRAEGNSNEPQSVTLILAKNRTGPTGDVDLTFLPAFTRFESAARIGEEDVPQRAKVSSAVR